MRSVFKRRPRLSAEGSPPGMLCPYGPPRCHTRYPGRAHAARTNSAPGPARDADRARRTERTHCAAMGASLRALRDQSGRPFADAGPARGDHDPRALSGRARTVAGVAPALGTYNDPVHLELVTIVVAEYTRPSTSW